MVDNVAQQTAEDVLWRFALQISVLRNAHVSLVLCPEPKSGTGTSEEWAWGALASTCAYLNTLYGGEACRTTAYGTTLGGRYEYHDMIFEPHMASLSGPRPCPCKNIER